MRTIAIKRFKPFSHENQKGLDTWLMDSVQSIGSYFTANGHVATGLTRKEEDILLPVLLGMRVTDLEYRKKVEEYFINLSLKVPYGDTGAVLNISLTHNKFPTIYKEVIKTKDGKNVLDEDGKPVKEVLYNLPENMRDYITYRWAKNKKGEVGENFDIAKSNKLINYYIVDNSLERAKKEAYQKNKEIATTAYLEVIQSSSKIDSLISLYGKDPLRVSILDKKPLLESFIEQDPVKFVELTKDKEANVKYSVSKLVNSNILRLENGKYFYMSSHIATGLDSMIAYYKRGDDTTDDSKEFEGNRSHVITWKAAYSEWFKSH